MSAISLVIERLEQQGRGPVKNGVGWKSRCPAHDDQNPSLVISEGDDGKVLVDCKAGCGFKAIAHAIGLAETEFFPANNQRNGTVSRSKGKGWDSLQRAVEWKASRCGTKDNPIQAIRYQGWQYNDQFWMYRFDLPDGSKVFHPFRRDADGWHMKAPENKRPLYHLDEIAGASEVWVNEGEKCADLARSLGVVATTPPNGAKAPRHADWSALAGKSVIAVLDNDKAGEDFGNSIGIELAKLSPKPRYKVVRPPVKNEGDDIEQWIEATSPERDNALLLRELRALADAAPEWTPPVQASGNQSGTALPEIIITPRRQEVAEATLATLPNDPELYSRGGSLGIIAEEDDGVMKLSSGVEFRNARGSARFTALSRPRIGCMLTRNARFVRERTDKKGNQFLVESDPPEWLAGAIETWGHWPGVRRILSITSCPFVRANGSILHPGYDADTMTLYRPVGSIGDIPENPTEQDAVAAGLRLFQLVGQFPFRTIQEKDDPHPVEDYDFAVWLAYVLSLIQRPAIAGPVPGFAFDANKAGSGKGMLIDIGGIIATGNAIPTRSHPVNPEEFSKVKLALALAGIPVVHFDNLPEGGFFGSGELDSALTSTETSGRILGASRDSGPVPLRPVWTLSGNNISPSKDAYRRWLPCRMETKLESPHERDDLRIANLKAHVQANRPALLADALTILKAHALAGHPVNWKSPLGSFEEWDHVVRGAVWFATGRDCLTTQRRATQESPERLEKIGLLKGWIELPDGITTGHTVAEGIKYAVDDPIKHSTLAAMLPAFTGKSGKPDAGAIGRKFRAIKGQHIDGMVLEMTGNTHGGVAKWRVKVA